MPRMFDILRGKSGDDSPEDKKESGSCAKFPDVNKKEEIAAPKSHPLSFPKNMLLLDVKKEKSSEDHSIVSKKLISAVKQHGVDDQDKAREIYESAVEIIKVLLSKMRAGDKVSEYMDKLHELLDDVFNQLVMGDNLLRSVYEEKKEEYHLPYHIVNILILSSVLGLNMGFNKSRLSHLGLASIFCDLGMDSLEELVKQPKMLIKEERETVKTHISRSLEIVNSIGVLNEIVKETIATHHERASGNGYPRGIGSEDINPYAKVLGLVDTYEAMTHTRVYREKMSANKAVRALIGPLKNDFDTDVVKVFINKMSVYPIGSIVRLDTGEMARVTSVRPGSPLRPVVMIFRGPSGEKISENNIIDLSRQDFPNIKE
ncbi:MAG: hypothetical protein NTZ95_05035 [Candidatus Omnitrophica bacterium]|nr:hypothetical protein [Candidatus Omnitrophota bacterium]